MGGASNPAMAGNVGRGMQPQRGMTVPMAQPGQSVYDQSANAYTGALQGTQAAMGYNPQQVSTQFGYNPQQVSAGTAAGGINTYMNPHTQQVINTSMADLERQRQTQMNALGSQATAAGAFGGSRQGVAEALTNQGFAQQGGQLASQLRQQGFETALGASQQDVANRLQANIQNQQAGGRAMEFGQQNRLQAQMANQQAGLQGAQQRMAAAGQLGNLSNTGFNFGQQIGQQQMQQGTMQQGMNQALIDAAKGQFGGFTGAPQDALSTYLAALGGSQTGQQTETQTQKPGLLQYLSLGLGLL